MTLVALSLGSNLDQPESQVRQALNRIEQVFTNFRASPLYLTQPVGGPNQPDFVNACAVIETSLEPLGLLTYFHKLEQEFGRVPAAERNQPRTLDIDLILYGNRVETDADLTIPHPRFHERRFVLEPLAQIAPQLVDPSSGKTIRQLLIECPDRHRVFRMDRK